MVNLWWIRGESWLGDGGFLASENFPRISDLFLVRVWAVFAGMTGCGSTGADGGRGGGREDVRIALTVLGSEE